MSVNMFVGASQSQAASVLAKSRQDQQAYENMLQALQQFIGEDRLNSAAYRNAKVFYSAVLMPLTKAGILLSEAVGEACQKFVQDYQGTVDSGDLKSEELEEKIQQLNGQISHLDAIRATIEGKDLADNFKIRQLNQNSQAKGLLEDARDMLQKKLDKLLDFHGTSPTIFSNISALEAMVSQGAAQAGTSFTGSGFSIPIDLGWTATIEEKWQTRAENIKKKEKEYHEKKIKELEKHNVYAWPYEDPETKEIKIMWFIDKDGVRVFDKELQEYVERYGKNLEGIYEVVDWEKIYELDLAARRRGDGKNYLNSNQLPKGWEWSGQANAHIESAYWMANKTGLLDLALMAGLVYLNKKTKVSTSKNVSNVLDDLDDVGKKNNYDAKNPVSGNDWENYFKDQYGAENVRKKLGGTKTDFGAENTISGKEWNNYFQNIYGVENVQWKPASLEDIISSPKRLYGSTKNEIKSILGEGWTEATYGSAGNGWKFTNDGDGMVFYHPGDGIHGGSYYGFSTGDTGKVKIVGEDYIDFSNDKATIIKFGGE